MPYGVFKTGPDDKPYCVYRVDGEGHKLEDRDTLGCHPSEEKAHEQIRAIGAATHARSTAEFLTCKAMPPDLLAGLCDKFGADEGFFTRCMAGDIGAGALDAAGFPHDPESFCAWLHKQCRGKWPGEKSVGSLIEGRIHESFTRVADQLFQRDVLSRDERVALSSAIGDSLTSLSKVLDKLGLSARDLDALVTETVLNAIKSSGRPNADISVVAYGGGLKALGDGRVGGHLVVFSPKGQHRDLVGDYFSRDTRYHWDGKEARPAWYNHGLDKTLGKKDLGTGWHLGQVDDIGLWVETQLDLRDQYEKAIYDLARKGKLGLSSGTAEHMIERDQDGRLTRWPIVEGSFTPVPAEPRTLAIPLRSLQSVSLRSLIESTLRDSGRGKETPNQRGSRPHQKRSARSARSVVEELVELFNT